MKCDACGNDMVWEGPIRGGYMVCWHCRSLDICHALNDPEPDEGGSYESYHFDPAEPGDDYLKELITFGEVIIHFNPGKVVTHFNPRRYMK